MLRRSWLFVPGNNRTLLQKAETLEADIIIYDLEDAVAINEKEEARKIAIDALYSSKKNVFVRVNSLESPYYMDDIDYFLKNYQKELRGVVLPKASDSNQIKLVENILQHCEDKYRVQDPLEIVPIIENATGLQFCYEISNASPRINQVAFGAIDYSLDVNITPSKNGFELMYARAHIANASRAAGILQPIDTVYANFNHIDGLQEEVEIAKRQGFAGKLIIHPNQIQVVNKSFVPTEQEVLEAQKILKVAETTGQSVFQLNGKMIDEPLIKKARLTLQKSNF
ncbi:citrate lyase subunit beta / citryl-CoA lyase [Alteribacillus persepolensis]|uniref:Citrate lyase subunit beta / citryl-CoA lyase n=1 Tax=Alteribacillus persepolensis TaxID=568899 RepID=A0A1G8EIP8_9BACI|nr:CoA ester lyase [Alteribacillus persepolensis]SDH69736.1 citrate lyase subunit beta / citryl-CoA lyase [Alteribacillus persepolensis]